MLTQADETDPHFALVCRFFYIVSLCKRICMFLPAYAHRVLQCHQIYIPHIFCRTPWHGRSGQSATTSSGLCQLLRVQAAGEAPLTPPWLAGRSHHTHKLACRSSRWAKPGPQPGTQIGTLELQSRGWENSTAWMWAAVPFMVVAILVLDLSIILCLAYLKSARVAGHLHHEGAVALRQRHLVPTG